MKHIIYGITTALCIALSGCEFIHDDPAELGYRENGEAYAYVSLTINTATDSGPGTRSNPTGGETGDGFEDGQAYENKVNDLTLFFYLATPDDGGVNNVGDNIPFVKAYYTGDITGPSDGTQPIDKHSVGPFLIEGLKTNQQYHVLAVANAGDLSENITTLNELREKTTENVYTITTTDGNTTYSNFVMASEGDEHPVLDIAMDNSQTNPAVTTIDLERLAARVDYKTKDGNSYKLSGTEITASITRAMLVNSYKQPTYLLKRVADDENGTHTIYLGDETMSNYVIDPHTSAKTLADASTNSSWYNHYFPSLSDKNSSTWEDWLTKGDEIKYPDTQEAWFRLGYPKENTSSVDAQGRYYSTGVVFEASYDIPNITAGATFFRYKGTIYPTLEEAMQENYNGDVNDAYFKIDQTFETFDVLTQYIQSLSKSNEDPAGYKDYLKTATAENFDGSQWTWEYYKEHSLGFEKGDDNILKATAETRKALHDRGYGTETFLKGRGYYIYWIRHNGGGEDDKFSETKAMAYGIVRNNIYKLTVNSISDIGDDTPGGNATLDILVAVRNWNGLPEDEVVWDD